jgi:hypothetical protein
MRYSYFFFDLEDIFFSFFSFIILRILSRIFEFSKIRHLDIKQKRFLYNEWKFVMVDLTTPIIFQYVYFIPQKAKCFAIAYFRVAC